MITWILLTRGDRADELHAALDSIRRQTTPANIIVVANGATVAVPSGDDYEVIELPDNIGVPGGRARGIERATTDVVAFLDDDAVLLTHDANDRIERCFCDEPRCGAISFRIQDHGGVTQRRHIPRVGSRGAAKGGPAATFLGGASAIRRAAYELAGGYWADLFYAHEELDLSWRLHDAGFDVQYRPEIVVRHPRTPIGRHPEGWYLTGRNRVLVARRNLPRPLMVFHAAAWFVLGALRARGAGCRAAYVRGWWAGWHDRVPRDPIRWSTAARLTRAGRPPIV
jgi:hypothetical protein